MVRRGGELHPGQVVAVAFAGAIAVGTGLLSLPVSHNGDSTFMDALFTATSAVCVTGLTVVDTSTHWTAAGQVIIMLLIQVGGLGIMTLATLAALLLSRRLGLRSTLIVQTESQSMKAPDVRRVVFRVVRFSLVCEAAIAVALSSQLLLQHGESIGPALYHGVFHAVSSFNNAGFSTYANNLVPFAGDPLFLLTICASIIIGGAGLSGRIRVASLVAAPTTLVGLDTSHRGHDVCSAGSGHPADRRGGDAESADDRRNQPAQRQRAVLLHRSAATHGGFQRH